MICKLWEGSQISGVVWFGTSLFFENRMEEEGRGKRRKRNDAGEKIQKRPHLSLFYHNLLAREESERLGGGILHTIFERREEEEKGI